MIAIRERLREIWAYRGFIFGSVKREFQSKYQGSLLGSAWTIIHPMAMIFVYTVIFSQIMQARLPGNNSTFSYSIYLSVGIITWGFFSEIVSRGQNIFLDNSNIIKKLDFPIATLPVIMVLNAMLNFSIIFGLFIGFLLITGNFPGWVFVTLIPVLLVQILFSVGLGLSLGVVNVFFRDVGQLFTILMQFWFWLTPIVYPIGVLPEFIRSMVLQLNPMAVVIGAYQHVLVDSASPEWRSLLMPTVAGVVFILLSVKLYSKHGYEIVDEL